MHIFISDKHLRRLEKIMSQFLDDFHTLLQTVISTQNDTAAIEELRAHLVTNDATDAEQSQAILELTTALGNMPPPAPPSE